MFKPQYVDRQRLVIDGDLFSFAIWKAAGLPAA